jgi:hypothetical protein
MCQAQAICIIPTPCCGGCECQPVPCNPGQSTCPDGSACVVDGLGDKGHCKQIPSTAPGGFYAQCSEDKDCLQEYFCQQTMFCIAPANGNDEPPPACNQNNCVPVPCDAQGKCPTASDCTPYGHPNAEQAVKTCVRDLWQVPGGYAGGCNKQEPACNSNQYFCQDLCYPAMCIIPVEGCIPIVCSPDKPGDCPKDAECKDVGVTTACVKK